MESTAEADGTEATLPPRVSRGKKLNHGERERRKGGREREEGTAGIPVARGNVGERLDERKREVERARERKTFLLPPLLATEAIFVARRRGERRGKSAGEREEKFSSSFPLSVRMPACKRGGRKMGKRGASRQREKRERERGREGESEGGGRGREGEGGREREREGG